MTIEHLLKPQTFGSLNLKNRIVMAPLTRSRANDMAVPAAFAAEYYGQRAGAGMIITEATQVSFEGMGYPRTPGIHTAEQMAEWKTIVDAVHKGGSTFVMQIWHVGRIASHLNRGVTADTVAPSAIQAPGQMYTDAKGMVDHDMPRALAADEIKRIAGDFKKGAENALKVGFDGVEFHSANGYLPHQFLSSNVNQRDDQYGGSIENRMRAPLEFLDAVIAAAGADKTGMRISPTHTFNGIEENDVEALYKAYLAEIEKRGLAYLHVMRPFTHDMKIDIVDMVRQNYKGKILVCGEYDRDEGEKVLADGKADAVAYGRAYIANPDLVERFKRGAELNTPDDDTFYTPGRTGYTDYPTLADAEAA